MTVEKPGRSGPGSESREPSGDSLNGATPDGRGGPPGTIATKYSPWLILFTLCLGFFMILLDTTIVNVAIPQMSQHLGASLSDILWILNGYILVYAVLLITAGRLGDLYGAKQLFLIGMVVFTAASAACGLSQNPSQMIIFRIIQGLGGALLTPQTLSVITMIFPPERPSASGVLSPASQQSRARPWAAGWLLTSAGAGSSSSTYRSASSLSCSPPS
jgi:MFS family permease